MSRWEKYGVHAFGPRLFFRHDIPETELEPIEPGSQLPGLLVALYDGRGRCETPLWLPEQRALVFADALTAAGGELRVWATPSHEERALPALRALLELAFDHVIVSPGEPIHTRAAYERAIELAPGGDNARILVRASDFAGRVCQSAAFRAQTKVIRGARMRTAGYSAASYISESVRANASDVMIPS